MLTFNGLRFNIPSRSATFSLIADKCEGVGSFLLRLVLVSVGEGSKLVLGFLLCCLSRCILLQSWAVELS